MNSDERDLANFCYLFDVVLMSYCGGRLSMTSFLWWGRILLMLRILPFYYKAKTIKRQDLEIKMTYFGAKVNGFGTKYYYTGMLL